MVTVRSESALRVTVTVTVSLSSTSYVAEPKLTVTLGRSLVTCWLISAPASLPARSCTGLVGGTV